MAGVLSFWEKPEAAEIYMIAGWDQWADAGSVSSALPRYLIDHLRARQIGELRPHGFYLFQVPGTHQLLRPEVKLEQGYRRSLTTHRNEFYYWGDRAKGLVIFLGDEPQVSAEGYAEAFLDAVFELNVRRVVVLGGIFSAVPYDRDRDVSCVYSHPRLKAELEEYAVSFSDYEGGVSIGTYLADWAERRGVELVVFYSLVPAYDFSPRSTEFEGIRIETDSRAWYELMRRLNRMFGLGIDLSDLRRRSIELGAAMEAKIAELEQEHPKFEVRKFLAEVNARFTETPFLALDQMWEQELGDLFGEEHA